MYCISEHNHAIPFHVNNVKQTVERNSNPTELRHETGIDKISEIKKRNIVNISLHQFLHYILLTFLALQIIFAPTTSLYIISCNSCIDISPII